jgi:hypothetical protein
MGCLTSKHYFKYSRLDSNSNSNSNIVTKLKKLGSNKLYSFFLECNREYNHKYYNFIINKKDKKDKKENNELVCKILLTIGFKPKFITYDYDDIENILYIYFPIKYYLDTSDIYIYNDYKIKIYPQSCKYRVLIRNIEID